MRLILTAKSKKHKDNHLKVIPISVDSNEAAISNLVELVKAIRPFYYRDFKQAERKFKQVLRQLEEDKGLLFSLRKVFLLQFTRGNIVPALTESGMVASRGFLQELLIRIKHKILPPLLEENNFLYVINHVFYRDTDYIWVQGIDKGLWIRFFELLGFQVDFNEPNIIKQLNQALHLICLRTVTLGLEKEIIRTLPNFDYHNYAFVKLDRTLQLYLHAYEENQSLFSTKESIENFKQVVDECQQAIVIVSDERRKKGTSLSQTYILFRLQQHLERINLVTDILDKDRHFNFDRLLNYFFKIIYYEKRRNSIREFINANFSFIAYQITEHSSRKGIQYITTTRNEFWQLFKSAMGGGIIISFTAVIKNFLSRVTMAPFWQGFSYSVNYFVGFQLMHETGTTLATKQPAFTASALVNSFDAERNGKADLHKVAITIARTIRSQLVSFAGNLLMVFPLTFLFAGLYHSLTGDFIVGGKQAHELLESQHPLKSLSLLYACFTGFFLFASGLIASYVENHINYGRIAERLKNHPLFKNTLTPRRLKGLTSYVEDNFGALSGNLALGFFLGMAGFFGKIFGIPFDIRHITISAGNTGIAYFAVGRNESSAFLLTVLGGVLLIGLLNFLVSFALAFLVAARSRGVRLRHYPDLFVILGRFFKRYPADFIRPPKTLRSPNDLRRGLKK